LPYLRASTSFLRSESSSLASARARRQPSSHPAPARGLDSALARGTAVRRQAALDVPGPLSSGVRVAADDLPCPQGAPPAAVSLKRYRAGPRRRRDIQSVPVDVKHLKLGSGRLYQFTAIAEATRFRVLKIYDHNSINSAITFIDEVRRRLPMAIQRIQTDHGSESGTDFTWHLQDVGILHRRIHEVALRATGRSSEVIEPTPTSSIGGCSSRAIEFLKDPGESSPPPKFDLGAQCLCQGRRCQHVPVSGNPGLYQLRSDERSHVEFLTLF
jgi:hypothetical protein